MGKTHTMTVGEMSNDEIRMTNQLRKNVQLPNPKLAKPELNDECLSTNDQSILK